MTEQIADTQKGVTKAKPKELTIYDIINHDAREFLDSMGRNSKRTQECYASGLLAFQKFIGAQRGGLTLQSIIKPLTDCELDVYKVLNDFVTYLMSMRNGVGSPIATTTLDNYMSAVRSYLQFYDIDISSNKFRRKVKMPRLYRQDEEAIDAADIRTILLSCSNRRLKPYILVLASAGLRATEACAIRLCDIQFNGGPTKIHVRREYTKTKVARDVYISDEATRFLKEWLKWKYRERATRTDYSIKKIERTPDDFDLVFTHHQSITDARAIYHKIRKEFVVLLKSLGFEKRKEGMQRRTITLHSFLRYVKTVISDQVSKDYSEWFLGHSKSPYYTMKEPVRREIYATKCMKYLTFLDYTTLETTGKGIEAKLSEKDIEIQAMKLKYEQDMKAMRDEMENKFQQILAKIDITNLK